MARKFGSVDTALWKHGDFKSLDDDSKLLFLYLKTCDHQNMIGCFHLPIMYMCADLGWQEKRAKETLCKLLPKGFVALDEGSETVFLPKHLTMHPLQNQNQGKGAEKLFDDVPSKFKYIKELAAVLLQSETLAEPFANRLKTLCNSVTVSVTETVTVTKGCANAPPEESNPEKKGDSVKMPEDFDPPLELNPDAWSEFKTHRKQIRKPMTYLAMVKASNQLLNLSREQQQECVDMSIQSGWPGLYPHKVKNETNQRTNSSGDRRAAVSNSLLAKAGLT